jgi:acyl carrier protein
VLTATTSKRFASIEEEKLAMSTNKEEAIWMLLVDSVATLITDEGHKVPPMSPATRINADLDVSSLSLVHLLLALEEKMGQGFEFEKIALRDGQYRTDMTLGELWEFLVAGDAETGMFDIAKQG